MANILIIIGLLLLGCVAGCVVAFYTLLDHYFYPPIKDSGEEQGEKTRMEKP